MARNNLSYSARFLFHDEGILGPYSSLWSYEEAQQHFRDYLYGINPDLNYWNSRWNRTGPNAFLQWSAVKTFAFQTHGWTDPQLQDHVAWVNWTFQRTLGNGAFERAVREIIPGALVGIHATYFSMINPNGPATHRPESPIGGGATFDFVSVPYYDGPNSFGLSFETYVDNAKSFFPMRPLLMGELGSQVCIPEQDCGVSEGKHWTAPRVANRQANFMGGAVTTLRAKGVGFNIWNLNEFPFPNREGTYGIYSATPNTLNTADNPRFKPAACALRVSMGSTASTLCLSASGVNNQYVPRAIWLSGKGFYAGVVLRLSNEAGTVYASQTIQPTIGSGESASFQVADDILTSLGCGAICRIGIDVVDTQLSRTSNRLILDVY